MTTLTTTQELAREFVLAFIAKSGVKEWNEPDIRLQIAVAGLDLADLILSEEDWDMAVSAVFRTQTGTAKTIKNSGGDAAITLASLANAAGRQAVKLDLGATRAAMYRVKASFEIAATPTAGATIDLYWAPSESATAGTDNPANVTGADAAYAGYSSNLTASLKQLQFIGSFICTAQATATVQYGEVGCFSPKARYGSLVVVNNSGAALHTTDTNQAISLIPVEDTSEPS